MRSFRLVLSKDHTAQHVSCVDPRRNTSEVTFSAVMKMKWLFMQGFECKSPISTVVEFLSLCQDRRDASTCLGSKMNSKDTAVEQTDYI